MLKLNRILFLTGIFALGVQGGGEAYSQILFDNTKAEQAGNADWIIDSNFPVPSPSITGITASTSETYWTGALSTWGVELAKLWKAGVISLSGNGLETLPSSGRITYGDATNSQDLSRYKVFVVCEPNILFSSAEKVAILTFVKNGGGLFMVADHISSDRNNDGADSLMIWNDLLSNNSVEANPFGISFNSDSTTPTSVSVDGSAGNPITRGDAGMVSTLQYTVGCTMTINDTAKAQAAVWSVSASTKVMMLYGTYGKGRFVAIGDSSVVEDNTNSGGTTYDGWTTPVSNGYAVLNATIWLLENLIPPTVTTSPASSISSSLATLNGSLNPGGLSTMAKFLYGTTTNYGSVTNVSGAFSGTNTTNVSVGLTGLSAGTTYHYALVATNSGGSVQGVDLSFTTWTALQAWRQQWFGTTNNSGSAADTYVNTGDGFSNLMKYALGLNPLVICSNPIALSFSGGYLTMTVPRSSSSTGITYSFESTGNLTSGWSSNSVAIDSNTPTLFKGHDTNPVSVTGRRFMRLKITQP